MLGTFEMCFFFRYRLLSFNKCLHQAYMSRTRAHRFSPRGSLGGDRLPAQTYAREVLCNFKLNMPTRPQSQQHVRMIAYQILVKVDKHIIYQYISYTIKCW